MKRSKAGRSKRFMNHKSSIDQYLKRYADLSRPLQSDDSRNLDMVVVIPAYVEKDHLFSTLASVAKNDPERLDHTMVVCVVNNKVDSDTETRRNNHETIRLLHALAFHEGIAEIPASKEQKQLIQEIADSRIRLGYIDASSRGFEIPIKEGGVGMARKIGMDRALNLLKDVSRPKAVMVCLDADTLVEKNYLSAIRDHYHRKTHAAVIDYAHRMPEEPPLRRAICAYEIYLRAYVLGLEAARSPYAYHAIGSTMTVLADAYLAVRGMNRRPAGEDFYFLNKLAKQAKISRISTTRVYPSARISRRVPFGTGAAIHQSVVDGPDGFYLYDPRAFEVVAHWIEQTDQFLPESGNQILGRAGSIHFELERFLRERDFVKTWEKISQNSSTENNLRRQFHIWFDGFETLKLINHLTRTAYPKIEAGRALGGLLSAAGRQVPTNLDQWGTDPTEDQLLDALTFLRTIT